MKRSKLSALCTALALTLVCGTPSAVATAASRTSSSSEKTVSISDTEATAETRALFSALQNTSTKDIRFGHQQIELSITGAQHGDVHEMTGQYPAVFGFDAGDLVHSSSSQADVNAAASTMAARMRDADSQGGIITLSAHWDNPVTNKDMHDTTEAVSHIFPGGDRHASFNRMLDAIVQVSQQAKRSDGTLIPIIFRPLHENNGAWFWWGATHATTSEYKELFRYIVNYMRDIKGVHNMLYAYSPGGKFNGNSADYLATYPGDEWVDVLGYDDYMDDMSTWIPAVVKDMHMIDELAQEHGKIAAFTEFGRKDIPKSGKDYGHYDFYDVLREALVKDTKHIAYMMTWANWGGDDNSFQSYTPWHGSDGEKEFVDFAHKNPRAMASASNVDFSAKVAAAAAQPSVRIVTPVNGSRLTTLTPTVRMKAENISLADMDVNSAAVILSRDSADDIRITLTYTCNGFFQATLDLSQLGLTLDQSTIVLTPHLALKNAPNGAVISPLQDNNAQGRIHVTLGEKQSDAPDIIDTFDTYNSVDDLRNIYSPNNTSRSNITLVNVPGHSEDQALKLSYDFNATPGYNGFVRSFSPHRDWSGYSAMSMYLEPDGSNHKFVVQINAGGVTFEAYPSLSSKDGQTITLNFGDAQGNGSDFAPASWDTAHADRKLSQELLSSIQSFSLYVNDNGSSLPRTGNLLINSVKLTGERDAHAISNAEDAENSEKTATVHNAQPLILDDFNLYKSDDAVRNAWSNRNHTEILSLTDGVSKDSKALALTYDFSKGDWYDVGRYIGDNKALNDWSGQGTLRVKMRADGSDNALALQIGTQSGLYFHTDIKLDFEGWKTIDIPLLNNSQLTQSWPENEHKGKTMMTEDLKGIKELVIAANHWNSDSTSLDIALGEISLIPSEDSKVSEENTPPTVEKTHISYTANSPSEDATNQPATSCPLVGGIDSANNSGSNTDTSSNNLNNQSHTKNKSTPKNGKTLHMPRLANTGSTVIGLIAGGSALIAVAAIALIIRKRL
ncbi:glycosyl hydrolase [Alloscardovia omnicolens]|uniref:glycosyl hydrolase n=1 Tax=Alloscardovia omnicolens TaxID=419015 RepID=UPI003A6345BB